MGKKDKPVAAPVAFAGASFDVEDGAEDHSENFDNPLKRGPPPAASTAAADEGAVADFTGMEEPEVDAIEANESAMTEDELEDLTYAFQAADMDGGGAIDPEEFSLMLNVMGCTISMDQVKAVITDAKKGFGEWLQLADAANVAKCQRIWTEYDDDKSGTMDLGELNVSSLHNLHSSPSRSGVCLLSPETWLTSRGCVSCVSQNVIKALQKLGSDLPLMQAAGAPRFAPSFPRILSTLCD